MWILGIGLEYDLDDLGFTLELVSLSCFLDYIPVDLLCVLRDRILW